MQKKVKIAITIDREILERVEDSAERSGLNRSQAIDLLVRMGILMLDSMDKNGGIDHGKITIC